MSDFRYELIKHDEKDIRLHVMIDGGELYDGYLETNIPLNMIEESVARIKVQELAQKILDIVQDVLNTGCTWMTADRMAYLISGLDDIEKLCKEQLEDKV